jgi:surface antigen
MLRYVIAGSVVLGIVGCSSTPRQSSEQFCDLKTETVTRKDSNGNIKESSVEVMKCSDNRIERMAIKQAGIAQNCEEYTYYITLNGRPTEQRGLACKKFNGYWEIIPNYSSR